MSNYPICIFGKYIVQSYKLLGPLLPKIEEYLRHSGDKQYIRAENPCANQICNAHSYSIHMWSLICVLISGNINSGETK